MAPRWSHRASRAAQCRAAKCRAAIDSSAGGRHHDQVDGDDVTEY